MRKKKKTCLVLLILSCICFFNYLLCYEETYDEEYNDEDKNISYVCNNIIPVFLNNLEYSNILHEISLSRTFSLKYPVHYMYFQYSSDKSISINYNIYNYLSSAYVKKVELYEYENIKNESVLLLHAEKDSDNNIKILYTIKKIDYMNNYERQKDKRLFYFIIYTTIENDYDMNRCLNINMSINIRIIKDDDTQKNNHNNNINNINSYYYGVENIIQNNLYNNLLPLHNKSYIIIKDNYYYSTNEDYYYNMNNIEKSYYDEKSGNKVVIIYSVLLFIEFKKEANIKFTSFLKHDINKYNNFFIHIKKIDINNNYLNNMDMQHILKVGNNEDNLNNNKNEIIECEEDCVESYITSQGIYLDTILNNNHLYRLDILYKIKDKGTNNNNNNNNNNKNKNIYNNIYNNNYYYNENMEHLKNMKEQEKDPFLSYLLFFNFEFSIYNITHNYIPMNYINKRLHTECSNNSHAPNKIIQTNDENMLNIFSSNDCSKNSNGCSLYDVNEYTIYNNKVIDINDNFLLNFDIINSFKNEQVIDITINEDSIFNFTMFIKSEYIFVNLLKNNSSEKVCNTYYMNNINDYNIYDYQKKNKSEFFHKHFNETFLYNKNENYHNKNYKYNNNNKNPFEYHNYYQHDHHLKNFSIDNIIYINCILKKGNYDLKIIVNGYNNICERNEFNLLIYPMSMYENHHQCGDKMNQLTNLFNNMLNRKYEHNNNHISSVSNINKTFDDIYQNNWILNNHIFEYFDFIIIYEKELLAQQYKEIIVTVNNSVGIDIFFILVENVQGEKHYHIYKDTRKKSKYILKYKHPCNIYVLVSTMLYTSQEICGFFFVDIEYVDNIKLLKQNDHINESMNETYEHNMIQKINYIPNIIIGYDSYSYNNFCFVPYYKKHKLTILLKPKTIVKINCFTNNYIYIYLIDKSNNNNNNDNNNNINGKKLYEGYNHLYIESFVEGEYDIIFEFNSQNDKNINSFFYLQIYIYPLDTLDKCLFFNNNMNYIKESSINKFIYAENYDTYDLTKYVYNDIITNKNIPRVIKKENNMFFLYQTINFYYLYKSFFLYLLPRRQQQDGYITNDEDKGRIKKKIILPKINYLSNQNFILKIELSFHNNIFPYKLYIEQNYEDIIMISTNTYRNKNIMLLKILNNNTNYVNIYIDMYEDINDEIKNNYCSYAYFNITYTNETKQQNIDTQQINLYNKISLPLLLNNILSKDYIPMFNKSILLNKNDQTYKADHLYYEDDNIGVINSVSNNDLLNDKKNNMWELNNRMNNEYGNVHIEETTHLTDNDNHNNNNINDINNINNINNINYNNNSVMFNNVYPYLENHLRGIISLKNSNSLILNQSINYNFEIYNNNYTLFLVPNNSFLNMYIRNNDNDDNNNNKNNITLNVYRVLDISKLFNEGISFNEVQKKILSLSHPFLTFTEEYINVYRYLERGLYIFKFDEDSNKNNSTYTFTNNINNNNRNNSNYLNSDNIKPLSFFIHFNIMPIHTNDLEYQDNIQNNNYNSDIVLNYKGNDNKNTSPSAIHNSIFKNELLYNFYKEYNCDKENILFFEDKKINDLSIFLQHTWNNMPFEIYINDKLDITLNSNNYNTLIFKRFFICLEKENIWNNNDNINNSNNNYGKNSINIKESQDDSYINIFNDTTKKEYLLFNIILNVKGNVYIEIQPHYHYFMYPFILTIKYKNNPTQLYKSHDKLFLNTDLGVGEYQIYITFLSNDHYKNVKMKKVMFDLFIFIDIFKNTNIKHAKNNLSLPYSKHIDEGIDFNIYDNTCKSDNYKRLFHDVKLLDNNNNKNNTSNGSMNEHNLKKNNNVINTNMNKNYFHIYDTYYMKESKHEIFFEIPNEPYILKIFYVHIDEQHYDEDITTADFYNNTNNYNNNYYNNNNNNNSRYNNYYQIEETDNLSHFAFNYLNTYLDIENLFHINIIINEDNKFFSDENTNGHDLYVNPFFSNEEDEHILNWYKIDKNFKLVIKKNNYDCAYFKLIISLYPMNYFNSIDYLKYNNYLNKYFTNIFDTLSLKVNQYQDISFEQIKNTNYIYDHLKTNVIFLKSLNSRDLFSYPLTIKMPSYVKINFGYNFTLTSFEIKLLKNNMIIATSNKIQTNLNNNINIFENMSIYLEKGNYVIQIFSYDLIEKSSNLINKLSFPFYAEIEIVQFVNEKIDEPILLDVFPHNSIIVNRNYPFLVDLIFWGRAEENISVLDTKANNIKLNNNKLVKYGNVEIHKYVLSPEQMRSLGNNFALKLQSNVHMSAWMEKRMNFSFTNEGWNYDRQTEHEELIKNGIKTNNIVDEPSKMSNGEKEHETVLLEYDKRDIKTESENKSEIKNEIKSDNDSEKRSFLQNGVIEKSNLFDLNEVIKNFRYNKKKKKEEDDFLLNGSYINSNDKCFSLSIFSFEIYCFEKFYFFIFILILTVLWISCAFIFLIIKIYKNWKGYRNYDIIGEIDEVTGLFHADDL
ncbi:conserved Plasmodium protein, unknown function [Plasmodium sp. DRC-Itaito]|nr:conserved Plasmodium protein, unknown function [Plasmodium sp. DRC-Itaito]